MATEGKPGSGPDDADRGRLAELLRSLGASEAELGAAIERGSGGDLALELVLRTGPPVTFPEAAAGIGETVEEFAQFWQALGFASPEPTEVTVPASLVAALPVVTQATRAWLGADTALGLARVIGTTSARLAEALVDAFRLDFEVPELRSGTSYAEVVERYVELTRASLPSFEAFVVAVLRAHLVRVARGAWAPDEEQQSTRRDLFVGFADLVGYTALSRTLSPRELATLLGRFEDTVAGVVTARGGRLVKLIGDGAMFVADRVEDGCTMALEVSERIAAAESLPPARVGADCGPVLSLYGDYFGDVVNRAARLVALANPGTVVVSESVAAGSGDSFGLERLPAQALKGFQAPAVSYRLQRR